MQNLSRAPTRRERRLARGPGRAAGRQNGHPLFTLESRAAVRSFDLLGVTLQTELASGLPDDPYVMATDIVGAATSGTVRACLHARLLPPLLLPRPRPLLLVVLLVVVVLL